MTAERREEAWARHVVSRALGVPVDAYDDNTLPSMPDALIHAAAADEPLEVVADVDSDYLRLQDALRRRGRTLEIDPAEPAWEVTLVHSSADLRRLRAALPVLLRAHKTDLLRDELPTALERLGVEDAHPLEGQFGFVHLSAAGWNSWDYDTDFGVWLDALFERESDVPHKLAQYGGTRQHAFVWVESFAAWPALDQLELDDESPRLPAHVPNVPRTLTDIWIASTLVRPTRGVLHWHRDDGWSWAPLELPDGV